MFTALSRLFCILIIPMLVACGGEGSESGNNSRSDAFLNITPALLSGKIFYYQYEADDLKIFEKISITGSDSLSLRTVLHDALTGNSVLVGDYPYSIREGGLRIQLATVDKEFRLKAILSDSWLVEMIESDTVEPLELKLYFLRPPNFSVEIQ